MYVYEQQLKTPVAHISDLWTGITAVVETIDLILQNIWTDIECQLYIIRETNGANFECVHIAVQLYVQ
jgi:hypothetical protein